MRTDCVMRSEEQHPGGLPASSPSTQLRAHSSLLGDSERYLLDAASCPPLAMSPTPCHSVSARMHKSASPVSIVRVTLSLLYLLTVSSLLKGIIPYSVDAFRVHPRTSAEAHTLADSEAHYNVTHDLFVDSRPSQSFNFSDWICVDRFLAGEDERPYELLKNSLNPPSPESHRFTCKCYLNSKCNSNNAKVADSVPHSSSLVNMSLWFRCYELDGVQPLESLVESLSTERILKKVVAPAGDELGQSLGACMLQARDKDKQTAALILRADLVRSKLSAKSNFEFINQLNSLTNIHLESVTIRESSLESIPLSLLSNWKHLKSLNLTSNVLTEFNSRKLFDQINDHLASLDLSHNNLSQVDLSWLVSLKSVDLSYNLLSTLSTSDLSEQTINLLKGLQQSKKKPLLDFNLANNPWECDTRLNWLINFISAIVETNGQIFESEHQLELFQTEEPECSSPHEAKMFPFSVWKSVKEVSICSSCDCYLEDKYANVGYRYVIVNCTDRHLDYLPTDLPKNAKIIDLSNNRIRKLSTLGVPKLSLWRYVNKLILQNNSLEAMDGLDQVPSIVYLDISGNLLTEIPYHILDPVLSGKFDKVRIGNNPFTCDCNTVRMQKWLQNNYRIILDISNVRCGYVRLELTQNASNAAAQVPHDRFHNREILKINSLELCPSIASVEIFDIINCALALLIVILISKATYDYFWQKRTGKLPRFFKVNI